MGCNFLGGLVVDVIIAIVTAGAAGPPIIAEKIGEITAKLSARLPASIINNVTKFSKISDLLGKLTTVTTTLNDWPPAPWNSLASSDARQSAPPGPGRLG